MEGFSSEKIRSIISAIPDPEIPVISIEELGILRGVEFIDNTWVVSITPTYSGCPAMKMIEDQIYEELKKEGVYNATVKLVYAPAWTTDWLSDVAKEKLRVYGIAPPEKTTSDKSILLGKAKRINCPRCASQDIEMVSQFGSTACKALYKCNSCKEPFDYFKCI